MPLYSYTCVCGAELDDYRTVEKRHDAPTHCGQPMSLRICGTRVMADIKPYKNMVDGRIISSRSAHRNFLKQHDLIEVGNEVETMLKPRQKVKLSNKNRKQRIAEILNNR